MKRLPIICVDDEKFVLLALKTQLRRALGDKYTIEITESAEEALELIDSLLANGVQIPLVISDQIMPGIKGDEFLIEVHKRSPSTLKILLTGQADASVVGKAVNYAKLYRYISKPWEESDLTLTVSEALKSFLVDIELTYQNMQLRDLNETLEMKVRQRTNEIEEKNKIIENKNKSITDSIMYAKTIQNAVLPPEQLLDSVFSQYFVINMPKDIVSGDFYWVNMIQGKLVVAVADCTGHGVPGGFMSMLGVAYLSEITHKLPLDSASQVLEEVRAKIKESLHQNGNIMESKDGMDIALCVFDCTAKTIQYAGANNSLYIMREGELIRYHADSQPAAFFYRETQFTNTTLDIEEGDTYYIFTDGFIDQLGSYKNKKFSTRGIRELLVSVADKSLVDQASEIKKVLNEWQGSNDQTDDMLMLGFRL